MSSLMKGAYAPLYKPVHQDLYGVLSASTAVPFDPATLFASGANGAWWEPSPSNCFQDAARTTAAGVGDPVGGMVDLSGNGNHFIGTAAQRPTLAQDGSGNYYLALDGTDDRLEATTTIVKPVSVVMAFNSPNVTAQKLIVSGATSGQGFAAHSSTKTQMFAGTYLISADALPINTNLLGSFLFNDASSVTRIDGVQKAAGTIGTMTNWSKIILGGYALFFSGRIYAGVAIEGVLSGTDLTNTETYFGAKAGLTI